MTVCIDQVTCFTYTTSIEATSAWNWHLTDPKAYGNRPVLDRDSSTDSARWLPRLCVLRRREGGRLVSPLREQVARGRRSPGS
jgi:hypothetical protein